jgi:hypothetical protein
VGEEDVIAEEAKRIESDALFTAQANFADATAFRRLRLGLGLPAAIFSALAGAAIVADWSSAVAGACAIIATVAATADLFVGSERRAVERHDLGVQYRALQHDARRLRRLAPHSASIDQRRRTLEEIIARQVELNRLNRAGESAFERGRKKIGRGEVMHPGDEDLT